MKVSELIAILEQLNQDAKIVIAYEYEGATIQDEITDVDIDDDNKVIVYGEVD